MHKMWLKSLVVKEKLFYKFRWTLSISLTRDLSPCFMQSFPELFFSALKFDTFEYQIVACNGGDPSGIACLDYSNVDKLFY